MSAPSNQEDAPVADRATLRGIRPMTRRQFLQRLALAGACSGVAGGAWAWRESRSPVVERFEFALPRLSNAFDGTTVAFLADTHHGPFVPLEYLAEVVRLTNALAPDIVALGGDYVQRRRPVYPQGNQRHLVAPAINVLGGLRAPLGRFAVLGNHDHKVSAMLTRRALAQAGFLELTNTGVSLRRDDGGKLWFCGVDDFRTGKPNLPRALRGCGPRDACLLLSHNPDLVERLRDPRVGLVLSGHTHGGQVVLPGVGAPFTASRHGQKYRAGLVKGPTTRVYVSRGVGTIGLPLRWGAPPEITLLTLRAG